MVGAGHDIGALGYFARRPLVDIAGLLSPELLPFVHDADALWQYRDARDVAILMAFPNQIPGFYDRDRRLCPLFATDGQSVIDAGASNITVYRLTWHAGCSSRSE